MLERRACCCGPGQRRAEAGRWLPQDRHGRGHPHHGVARARGRLRPQGRAGPRPAPTATASSSTAPSGTSRSRLRPTRLVVLARTGDGRDRRRPLPRRPEGRGRHAHPEVLASPPTPSTRWSSTTSQVGRADRIGAAGTGWATWDADAHEGLVFLAAQAIGGAAYALEITVQYAKDREQFDKPLGAFQAISHYLADAATAVDGGRILVYEAAWALAEGRSVGVARPDGQAVRLPDLPRHHRHGRAGLRRRRLHPRVRHPAVLPSGQGPPDRLARRLGPQRAIAVEVLDQPA